MDLTLFVHDWKYNDENGKIEIMVNKIILDLSPSDQKYFFNPI